MVQGKFTSTIRKNTQNMCLTTNDIISSISLIDKALTLSTILLEFTAYLANMEKNYNAQKL